MAITSLSCCGIKEFASIGGYSSTKAALVDFCRGFTPTQEPPNESNRYTTRFNCAFALFSEAGPVTTAKYGTNLAAYITKNKLGEVTEVPGKRNPNSGNIVRPFVWAIDVEGLKAWANINCSWLKKTGVNTSNV